MTDAWTPPSHGALDETAWPERLVAKAVSRGDSDDRLHGYALLGDLARHYSFSDVLFSGLTGELPDRAASRRFALALLASAPTSVAEAPTHVALLGRIAGGAFSAALGAGLLSLADQARSKTEHHAALVAWFADPSGELPACACDATGADRAWIASLQATLGGEATLVRAGMSRDAAKLALFADAGIREPERVQAALTVAGSLGVIAEALLAGPSGLGAYPVTLPPFHYIEPDHS
ncbi:MAG: hypothetical protein ABI591_28820 [Kofleriaceae bacterium]